MREEIVQKIICLLVNDPFKWKFTEYHAIYNKKIEIWIANVSYADLTIGKYRIGTWWSRRKIRKAMKYAKEKQILEHFD